jgi:hypothetical protein
VTRTQTTHIDTYTDKGVKLQTKRIERLTLEELAERIAHFTPKDIDAISHADDFYSEEKMSALDRALQLVSDDEVERVKVQLAVSGHFNPIWGISKQLIEALCAVLAGDAISELDYMLLTKAVLDHD